MSISLYLYGIKPQTEQWHAMREAYEACVAARVVPPKKVLDFFGFDEHKEEEITDEGVVVTLADYNGPQDKAVSDHNKEMENGYVVELSKLNSEIETLRFAVKY